MEARGAENLRSQLCTTDTDYSPNDRHMDEAGLNRFIGCLGHYLPIEAELRHELLSFLYPSLRRAGEGLMIEDYEAILVLQQQVDASAGALLETITGLRGRARRCAA